MKLTQEERIEYLSILERLKKAENDEALAEEKYIELAIAQTNLVRAELDLFIRRIKMRQGAQCVQIKGGSLLVCMKYQISFIDAGAKTQIGLMVTVIGLVAYYKLDFLFWNCTICRLADISSAAMERISTIGLVWFNQTKFLFCFPIWKNKTQFGTEEF